MLRNEHAEELERVIIETKDLQALEIRRLIKGQTEEVLELENELKTAVTTLEAEHARREEELESKMHAENERMMADMESSLKARFADVVLSGASGALVEADLAATSNGHT
jgi:hypothetical protein